MAYNPAMYQTYGNMYGNSYGQSYGPAYGQMSMGQYPQQQSFAQGGQGTPVGIIWVDGEVGAKAQQMPAGWPVNTPLPLWDTNDTIIYLKSMNQMGMPNPLQRIHYTMEENGGGIRAEQRNVARMESGAVETEHHPDMSEYVRKDDLDAMKEELKNAIHAMQQNQSVAASTDAKGARTNGKSAV